VSSYPAVSLCMCVCVYVCVCRYARVACFFILSMLYFRFSDSVHVRLHKQANKTEIRIHGNIKRIFVTSPPPILFYFILYFLSSQSKRNGFILLGKPTRNYHTRKKKMVEVTPRLDSSHITRRTRPPRLFFLTSIII
jgi:hypothetical protein